MIDAPRQTPSAVNFAANFAATGVAAASGLITLPIYLNTLGTKGLGFLGFAALVMTLARMLDLGLGTTVIRELSHFASRKAVHHRMPNVARTYELLFAFMSATITLVIVALAPVIATYWLQIPAEDIQEITWCLRLTGVMCGITWLSNFYASSVIAFQRQVGLSLGRILETLVSTGGCIVLALRPNPRIEHLLLWQIAVSTCFVLFACALFKHTRPGPAVPGSFHSIFIRRAYRFVIGMALIHVTGLLLANVDKIILSRLLTLSEFANYSVPSSAVGLAFSVFMGSLFSAMLPRFSALVAQNDQTGLANAYRLMFQTIIAILIPFVVCAIFFSFDFLTLWTHNQEVSAKMAPVMALLTLGLTLTSMMVPAFILQLASGWTTLGLILNIILLVVFTPVLYLLATHMGLEGAAWYLPLMNTAYVAMGLPLTHRKFLPDLLRPILVSDLLPMVGVALAASALLAWFNSVFAGPSLWRFCAGVVTGIALTAINFMLIPALRTAVAYQARAIFPRFRKRGN
jgi:O-antigen/teichoic acid export membrane protein